MDPLTAIALALGSSWASGINLYATVLVLGGLNALGVLPLPEDLQVLSSTWVLAAAALLYFIEFFADKIPGLDSLWDLIHTFIRIPAGALLAAGAVGGGIEGFEGISTELQTIIGLFAGGALAAGTHAAKAGSRAVINTSPEPFTNWGMSLFEDALVFGGLILAIFNPKVFLIGLLLFVLLLVWLVPKIWRGIARFFGAYKQPGDLKGKAAALSGGFGFKRPGAPATTHPSSTKTTPTPRPGTDADFFDKPE